LLHTDEGGFVSSESESYHQILNLSVTIYGTVGDSTIYVYLTRRHCKLKRPFALVFELFVRTY